MWAFRSLWDKGLVYEGFRVLAYCWRCETPLSNTETRMDDVYQDRQDPALTVGFELLDGAARRRPPARLDDDAVDAAGQPRPRRRTRTSSTPSSSTTGCAHVLADDAARGVRRRARRRPSRRHRARAPISSASRYRPLFDFFADHAERLPGARCRVRVDRGGHRHRPPGAGVRRGRPGGVQRRRHPDGRADGRARPLHGRGAAVGRRARLRGQPARHPPPQGRRRRAAPRDVRPPVPALLALLAAARLPGDLVVVRRGHEVPRPHGRAQRRRSPGCPST